MASALIREIIPRLLIDMLFALQEPSERTQEQRGPQQRHAAASKRASAATESAPAPAPVAVRARDTSARDTACLSRQERRGAGSQALKEGGPESVSTVAAQKRRDRKPDPLPAQQTRSSSAVENTASAEPLANSGASRSARRGREAAPVSAADVLPSEAAGKKQGSRARAPRKAGPVSGQYVQTAAGGDTRASTGPATSTGASRRRSPARRRQPAAADNQSSPPDGLAHAAQSSQHAGRLRKTEKADSGQASGQQCDGKTLKEGREGPRQMISALVREVQQYNAGSEKSKAQPAQLTEPAQSVPKYAPHQRSAAGSSRGTKLSAPPGLGDATPPVAVSRKARKAS